MSRLLPAIDKNVSSHYKSITFPVPADYNNIYTSPFLQTAVWDVRVRAGHPEPETASFRFHYAYEQRVKMKSLTWYRGTDRRHNKLEVGEGG